MKLFTVYLVSLVVMIAVGASSAQTMIPFRPQPQPLILGEVQGDTDHSVTIKTDAGEVMTLKIDSRSVVPTTLAPGTPVSVEFHLMPNGDYYAARMTPVEKGSPEAEHIAMSMSGTETEERTVAMPASYTATSEEQMRHEEMAANTTTEEARETPAQEAKETTSEDLPRTASSQPLTLALGSLFLGLGSGLWLGRRRRAA